MSENDGQTAVLAGVAAGAGSFLGTLLSKRPAAAAASEDKLDHLIDLSTAILAGLERTNLYLAQIAGAGPGAISESVLTPWVARDAVVIFDQEVRQAGDIPADLMVDYSNGKRAIIKVESSLDQAADIQTIGNIVDSFDSSTDIGPVIACPANDNISIGLAWDDWHPWIGVRMNLAVAPTAGRLRIAVVIQD
ncbi:MAG: hypothetical protein WC551_09975 [Patescibacteria group bacterium]